MIVQTPGVYIKEKSILPSSVAGVSTAVPVFIGFTEKIPTDTNKKRITSLFEFENLFGGKHEPDFELSLSGTPDYEVTNLVPNRRFFLYDTLHLYFGNGGGPCHIISAGTYASFEAPLLTEPVAKHLADSLNGQIPALDLLDEATLVLIPDVHMQFSDLGSPAAVDSLAVGADYKSIVSAVIDKCAVLKDKFAIFDYLNQNTADLDIRSAMAPSLSKDLKYGAVYYPWLRNTLTDAVALDRLDYAPSSGDASYLKYQDRQNVIDDIQEAKTAYNLSEITAQSLYAEYEAKRQVFVDGNKTATDLTSVFLHVYDLITSLENLATSGTAGIDILTQLDGLKSNQVFKEEVRKLIRLHHLLTNNKPQGGASNYLLGSSDNYWTTAAIDLAWFNNIDITNLNDAETYAAIDLTDLQNTLGDNLSRADLMAKFHAGGYVDYNIIFSAIAGLMDALQYKKQLIEDQLFTDYTDFINIKNAVQDYMKQIPAQGAVAGVYCKNDRDRGVWKSPANIAVQGIERPLVEVSNAEQNNLNVDSDTGKSINVIRTFTGKGPLIWGARTLAGNSNEWRYIAVRRFYNYAEESIKNAMGEYVFEPNNARTWVKIKAMITSFLVNQWRNGALVGTSMDEAFFVKVGEDTTSPAEILAGIINVQIGLAVARPAEFIILEFSHQTKS